jgi:hypothetical protein
LISHSTLFGPNPPYLRKKMLFAFREFMMRQLTPPYFSNPLAKIICRPKVANIFNSILFPAMKKKFVDMTFFEISEFFRRIFFWGESSNYEKKFTFKSPKLNQPKKITN